MRFEWDPAKNRRNIRKHGLDFTDGKELFLGGGPFWVAAELRGIRRRKVARYWGDPRACSGRGIHRTKAGRDSLYLAQKSQSRGAKVI